MIKKLLVVLLVLMANVAMAQKVDQSALVGKWIVKGTGSPVEQLPPDVKQVMDMMRDGFMYAKFEFKADGNFSLEFQESASDMMKELIPVMSNSKWKFDGQTQMLMIGTESDHYNHMRMSVMQQQGKYFFAFNDTPIVLEMEKQ
ncbi:hypothetical protein V6R21_11320 [Limibacter armeniacum]|uniref:hypothetical protein n=1 Tax=Limibacter armeniacum TaxID=466084 RepID=UPI002FE61CCA